jgi:hypothetical protein
LKRILLWLGGLLGLVLLSGLGLYGLGWVRLNRTYPVDPVPITIPVSSEQLLLEGQRIFRYRGCEACHGEELQGLVYLDNPAIGQVITPNLTQGIGGIGSERSDLDLIRAIRHGLDPAGKPLLFMPSTEFYFLSNRDLGLVLAYLRSVPAVDNQTAPSRLSPMGFIAMNLTREITFLPAELIPHEQDLPVFPEPGLTVEYGEYLSLSCPVCHGMTLSGGEIPGFPAEWPAAGNLTTGTGSRLVSWGEGGFIDLMRDGQKHGRGIHPDYMPWRSYRYMSDLELRAVYMYLLSMPAQDFGNRSYNFPPD